MDSITLENFISFCDDMQIANEGFNVSFSDIKERFIVLLQDLYDKIRLFLAKITKNREVTVNKEFFKLYTDAKLNIDNAYKEHCSQYAKGEISTYYTDRLLTHADNAMKKISETPATPVEGETGNTIKLYDIYKAMIESQQHVKNILSWIKLWKDPDEFEKLDNEMELKINNKYLSFYTSIYNKICKLK